MDHPNSAIPSQSDRAYPIRHDWQEQENPAFRGLGLSEQVKQHVSPRQFPGHIPISQYAAPNTYTSPRLRSQRSVSDLNTASGVSYAQRWPVSSPSQHVHHHRSYSDVSCLTTISNMPSDLDPTYNTAYGHDASDVSVLTARDSQMSPYLHQSLTVPALDIPRSISGTREQFIPPAPGSPPLPAPPTSHATTVDALANALRTGLRPSDTQRPILKATTSASSLTAKPTSFRMPFANDEPASPTSIYTDVTTTQQRQSGYIPSSIDQTTSGAHLSRSHLHTTPRIDEEDRSLPKPPLFNVNSNPIVVGPVGPSFADKVPPSKRPTRLNIDAVRDMEARGSTTSLSDLIRRATTLASNLDRGRTASRLGLLDAFNNPSPPKKKRGSTYSDILQNFPQPENGSIRTDSRSREQTRDGGGKPVGAWSSDMKEKSALAKEIEIEGSSVSQHRRRRICCGLRPWLFALIVLLVVLVTAVAVLVPVFLVLLPKLSRSGFTAITSTSCAQSNSCQNGGYTLVLNNTCSCICSNGFTGTRCTVPDDGACMTADLTGSGSTTYRAATIGQAVLPVIESAQQNFTIPLNMTLLLSTFSKTSLSCSSQNSLMRFNTSTVSPQNEQSKRRSIKHETLHILARQAAAVPSSANGIVFAPTPTPTAPLASASAPATAATATAPAPAATTSVSTSISTNPPPLHFAFAASSVLYILQSRQSLADATTAWSLLLGYLKSAAIGTAPANHTVQISGSGEGLLANFEDLSLRTTTGARILQ